MKHRKAILGISLTCLALAAFGTGTYFTLAKLERTRVVVDENKDNVEPSGEGRRTSTWYLLINAWHSYDTGAGVTCDYYVLTWMKSSEGKFGSSAYQYDIRWIKGELEDNTLHRYIFNIDIRFDYFQFLRMRSGYVPTSFDDRNMDGSDCYNSTEELSKAGAGTKTTYEVSNTQGAYNINEGEWV